MRNVLRSLIVAFAVAGAFAAGCASAGMDIGGMGTGGDADSGTSNTAHGPGTSGWTKGDGSRDSLGSGGATGGAGGAGGAGIPVGTGGTGGTASVVAADCHYASDQQPLDILAPRGALESAPYLRGLSDEGLHLPPPGTVDIESIRAFYKLELPIDKSAPEAPRVALDVLPGEGGNRYLLQVVVQAPPLPQVRSGAALAVVLDTSLSMAPSFARALAAVQAVAKVLDRPGDSLTVFTTSGQMVPITLGDAASTLAQLQAFSVDGGEDLGGAVSDAYIALKGVGGWVVLVTDGAAKAISLPLQTIVDGPRAANPVRLVGVGVGQVGTYDAALLRTAATNGDGTSLFLDDATRADALLGARFGEILQTWAHQVTVNVKFPHNVLLYGETAGSDARDGGTSDASVDTFVPQGGMGFGRTLVMRRVLESCLTPTQLQAQTFAVSVSWKTADGMFHTPAAAIDGPLGKNYHPGNDSPRLLKLAILDAYAQALTDLRPPLLKAAAKLIDDSYKYLDVADQPDADEVHHLLDQDLKIAQAQAAGAP
jgi:hypothetical protein